MLTLFLAIRNIVLQRKRHTLISISIVLLSSVMIIITGMLQGSLESIKIKAARYFSGHVSITGYMNVVPQLNQPEKIISKLKNAALLIRTVAARTGYYYGDATIFFNGETIRQRKLIGIDFSIESQEFKSLTFSEGSCELLATDTSVNTILISRFASRILGCRVGDNVTLSIRTESGQFNTESLIVRGIFNEASIFGYVAYMRRADLNRLLLRVPEFATDIAVYAEDGTNAERFAQNIHKTLSGDFEIYPQFKTREERDAAIAVSSSGVEKLVILSQNAQLAEIKQLMDALKFVAYFSILLFTVIVMVGVLNTYRVIVHERTKETGILRSMGMKRNMIQRLFLTEAVLLAFLTSSIGVLLGILVFRFLTIIDLSFIPAAGLFLEGGHLKYSNDTASISLVICLFISAALIAAWGPSKSAAQMNPADALRSR